jgi:hypothetical protein
MKANLKDRAIWTMCIALLDKYTDEEIQTLVRELRLDKNFPSDLFLKLAHTVEAWQMISPKKKYTFNSNDESSSLSFDELYELIRLKRMSKERLLRLLNSVDSSVNISELSYESSANILSHFLKFAAPNSVNELRGRLGASGDPYLMGIVGSRKPR